MSEDGGGVPAGQQSTWSSFLKQIMSSTGDLSSLTAPSFILSPTSLTEFAGYWGEPCEELVAISKGETAEERMLLVLKWYISSLKGQYTAREVSSGSEKKPFNPVLGEQFLGTWQTASSGETTLVSEQVSHHPPITAFHIENKAAKIVVEGHFAQKTSFSGKTISVRQVGFARLRVGCSDGSTETYIITLPKLRIDGLWFGKPYVELSDAQHFQSSSGMHATVKYEGKGYFSGKPHSFKATIAPSYHLLHNPLYVIEGQWDKDGISKFTKGTRGKYAKEGDVFINVPLASQNWKSVNVKPISEQGPMESRRIWQDVSDGIRKGDFDRATAAKTKLENEQRQKRKEEQAIGVPYELAYFTLVASDDDYAALAKKYDGSPETQEAYVFKS